MKKKILLFILTFTLFASPLHGNYYTDLLKKLVPSWKYGAAWLASGLSFLYGLQKVNNSGCYQKFPNLGDFTEQFVISMHSKNGAVEITQNGKKTNLHYTDSKCLTTAGSMQANYRLSIRCPRLFGPARKVNVTIKEGNPKQLLSEEEWPSKHNVIKGLGLAGLGAVGLLGTTYALVNK